MKINKPAILYDDCLILIITHDINTDNDHRATSYNCTWMEERQQLLPEEANTYIKKNILIKILIVMVIIEIYINRNLELDNFK